MASAIGLIDQLETGYQQAGPSTRRQINQAVFKRLEVDSQGSIEAVLQEPIAQLVSKDLAGHFGRQEFRTTTGKTLIVVHGLQLWWRRWDLNPRTS